jgi:hypothetical protein
VLVGLVPPTFDETPVGGEPAGTTPPPPPPELAEEGGTVAPLRLSTTCGDEEAGAWELAGGPGLEGAEIEVAGVVKSTLTVAEGIVLGGGALDGITEGVVLGGVVLDETTEGVVLGGVVLDETTEGVVLGGVVLDETTEGVELVVVLYSVSMLDETTEGALTWICMTGLQKG